MATHSSILAWKIPRTEETGRLQPMGSQRAGHGSATKQHEVSGTKLDTEDEMVAEQMNGNLWFQKAQMSYGRNTSEGT